jgi:hypothetical protein
MTTPGQQQSQQQREKLLMKRVLIEAEVPAEDARGHPTPDGDVESRAEDIVAVALSEAFGYVQMGGVTILPSRDDEVDLPGIAAIITPIGERAE